MNSKARELRECNLIITWDYFFKLSYGDEKLAYFTVVGTSQSKSLVLLAMTVIWHPDQCMVLSGAPQVSLFQGGVTLSNKGGN